MCEKEIGAEIYSTVSTCDYATPAIGSSLICINLLFTAFSALFLCYRTDDILCGILATVVVRLIEDNLQSMGFGPALCGRRWTKLSFSSAFSVSLIFGVCENGSQSVVHLTVPGHRQHKLRARPLPARQKRSDFRSQLSALWQRLLLYVSVELEADVRGKWNDKQLIEFIAMGFRVARQSSSTSIQMTRGEIKVLAEV